MVNLLTEIKVRINSDTINTANHGTLPFHIDVVPEGGDRQVCL